MKPWVYTRHPINDSQPKKRSFQNTPMRDSLRSLSRAFRAPVSNETRRLLQVAWERLPEHLRTSNQFLGRQYADLICTPIRYKACCLISAMLSYH